MRATQPVMGAEPGSEEEAAATAELKRRLRDEITRLSRQLAELESVK